MEKTQIKDLNDEELARRVNFSYKWIIANSETAHFSEMKQALESYQQLRDEQTSRFNQVKRFITALRHA